MEDRDISIGCVVAVLMWAATCVLLGLGWALDHQYVALIGLACSAAAATASIRHYHVTSNRIIRNAFELGRDSARIRAMH